MRAVLLKHTRGVQVDIGSFYCICALGWFWAIHWNAYIKAIVMGPFEVGWQELIKVRYPK